MAGMEKINIKLDDKTKLWIKSAMVRALKTVAQSAVAAIGTTMAVSDVAWGTVISISLGAGILSLLTSLAGLPEVENASIVSTESTSGTEAGEGTDKQDDKEDKS